MDYKNINEEEVKKWCGAAMVMTTEERAIAWLTEILNGEYELSDAREDVLSFNPRTNPTAVKDFK